MDPRQSLSRTASASIPQSPYSNPNMTSAYAGSMPPAYGQGHSLPPISSQYPAPPHHPTAGQPYQMPQAQFRDQRYAQNPSPASTPDRFGQQMAPQQGMNNMPQGGMLPQPQAQPPQQSPYTTQAGSRPNIYPQPLAPAPPRTNMDPYGSYGQPGGDRQWSGPEQIPGRPPVMPNGLNGSAKGPAIPQKDADGKFPCPNCTKTYLHAKHLKRHMLRHTGDRPYMCVLCNDTFSRSDILKRHFQKCSVRRGNPTGASHLSNPAAHLKKSQAAAAKAAAAAAAANASQQSKSQTGTGTPTSSTPVQQSPYAAMSSAGSSMPATTASLPAMTTMPFANGQSDMHRTAGPQGMQNPGQNGMDQNGNANWNMQNARTNQMMYNSNNASPAQGGPHVSGNDSWNQFLPAHDGGEYNMSQMYGYDHNQTETKTEAHEGGSNNYYMPSTSLGADGLASRAAK